MTESAPHLHDPPPQKMIAFINSIVAGVGVAMLAGRLLGEKQTLVASLIGAGVALALMAAFLVYQKRRYDSTA